MGEKRNRKVPIKRVGQRHLRLGSFFGEGGETELNSTLPPWRNKIVEDYGGERYQPLDIRIGSVDWKSMLCT